ncbi:MAG TPA: metal ABC transporter permease [Microthrixaceae bacterium]|nr:metal ABC transporter permease [Microthrixaceae bacterium]
MAGRVLASGASVLADIGYQPEWTTVMGSSFMRHALIAGTLVALVAGPIGYFVVVRRDSFAAHALAHIGFPGATAAVLLGAPVTAGLAVFCTAGGLAIGLLGRRTVDRETATGTILALSTALGILFASMASEGAAAVTDVLFGNLLAVTTRQLWTFSIMAAVVLVVLAVIARPLLFASIAPDVAAAKGVATGALGLVLMVLLALVTTGTSGQNLGYGYLDLPVPVPLAGQGLWWVSAQWLVLGTTATFPGGMTQAMRWRH